MVYLGGGGVLTRAGSKQACPPPASSCKPKYTLFAAPGCRQASRSTQEAGNNKARARWLLPGYLQHASMADKMQTLMFATFS